jgi:Fe(3+) dicitrate transport protein
MRFHTCAVWASAACLILGARGALGQADTSHITRTPSDTAHLHPVTVSAPRATHAVDVPPPVAGGIVYDGKTADLVRVDSTGANTGRDVTRQVFSRIPGANISELEAGGFPGNGVGFRGLNPTQSIEMNVRQNGVNIAGDLYGYNETYYTPPAEAVDDVLLVRGASSLAYGPQFGGAIDYILKHGTPNTPPTVDVSENVGSYGLFDTFGSVGGGTGRFTYYAMLQHRSEDGWRPNSAYDQTDAYARVDYQASASTSIGLEYTRFRNQIHMPGGLTDAEFDANPQLSYRARNWLATPWNIVEAHLDSRLSDHLHVYLTSSLMLAQRYLVWRSEAGGPQVADSIDPATDQYVPREVDRERFYNITNEARLAYDRSLAGHANTLTAGVREFTGQMARDEGGVGSTGTDFNMTLFSPYTTALNFGTDNVAAFAEDLFRLTDRWTITPGVRAEWLRSTIDGLDAGVDVASQAKDRTFALGGLGTEYAVSPAAIFRANISQAYRPITYDALTPFGSSARISPNLQDGHGYDVDLGWRGTPVRGVSASATGFYMVYDHREGYYSGIDTTTGSTYVEEATIGNSIAKGVEGSFTFAPLVALGVGGPLAGVSFFDAGAYDDAHYVTGAFAGNSVEWAPRWINRVGLAYSWGPASTTLQVSTQTHSFTDANNTVRSPDDAGIGVIPGYSVADWSIDVIVARHYRVWFGINNLTNTRYFTDRTVEYPGPGIIPSPGRNFTFGVSFLSGHDSGAAGHAAPPPTGSGAGAY